MLLLATAVNQFNHIHFICSFISGSLVVYRHFSIHSNVIYSKNVDETRERMKKKKQTKLIRNAFFSLENGTIQQL